MNIARWSIEHSVITWVATAVLAVVGLLSFQNLSRLEDPEFTIKDATIFTPYPGASAAEVELEVSDKIEQATQQLGQLFYVESHSYRGKSIVKVTIKDKYDKTSLPQVWDELRRKVNDMQDQLPPGAGPSIVNDDFGDVFGVYLAITGEGFSYKDLYETAKFLRREFLLVKDVKKVTFYGVQSEAVYVEMDRKRMTALGVSPSDIASAMGGKNVEFSAGYLGAGGNRLAIDPTGEFSSHEDFQNLLINAAGDPSRQVLLGDVADIRRGYREPPTNLLRYDGKPAVGLAISTAEGGNVVRMGEGLRKRLFELTDQIPLGIELNVVSLQSQSVITAINNFLISLLQAVAIVVLVLLYFMGLRSGLIIGTVLVVTIMGTFIFMNAMEVSLERISLGALIIALGMLVDNAIVVTDGMRVRIDRGEDALSAVSAVVSQTAMPLLGATAVAITAFASIGTSEDSTGEYTRSLFTVILISLSMSWLTAVTTTPLMCKIWLKRDEKASEQDPYAGVFYQRYRRFLTLAINNRSISIAVIVGVFVAALYGFGFVKNSFFPDSTRPQFYIDVWYPEGTDIRQTAAMLTEVEEAIKRHEEVTHITTQIGGSSPRFLLTYTPEQPHENFARLLVDVTEYRAIETLYSGLQNELESLQPDANINVKLFVLGPAKGGKIQLRISGPDREQLRQLANQAKAVILANPNVKGMRDEWDEPTKVLRPRMADTQARKLGIERPDIVDAMAFGAEGVTFGVYREDDELLPIIARAPVEERREISNLDQLPIWSPVAKRMVPLGQVVTDMDLVFEDAHIWRRDRVTMARLHFDQRQGLSSELLAEIKPQVEQALGVDAVGILEDPDFDPADWDGATLPLEFRGQLPLKNRPGYYIAWGGENEDSVKGAGAIASSIPAFFGAMVFIVICLFNSIRKMLVVWLVVPLAIVGVTVGLLMFSQPFGFMALLGFMSLAGMLIKNAIVLVDQITVELAEGRPPVEAVVESGVSRLIPVAMAAVTTIMGMMPLLTDAFFVAMAVTIMFGLGFATVLTLVVVPLLYATIFGYR